MHRALEIGAVLGRALEAGHPLAFVTLTMRHRKGQALADLWDAAAKGWRRAISGKGWAAASDVVVGWVRVWEVTHGRNGWHVHVHAVLVMAEGATAADLERVGSGMFRRWSAGVVSAGYEAPQRRGQDWHLVAGQSAAEQLADYLAKQVRTVDLADDGAELRAKGLGLELTHARPGRARADLRTRPVWALLDDLVAAGEAVTLARWHEWESGSKGRKQVGWSNGLRERFAPSVAEATDQDIVDQVVGDEADDLVAWDHEQWRHFIGQAGRAVALLGAAERGGLDGALALLRTWPDVAYSVVRRGPGGAGGAARSAEGGRTAEPAWPVLVGDEGRHSVRPST